MVPSPPRNPNYAATVVVLKDFVALANCDNIQAALIFGYSVIVAKQAMAGDVGLFFPAETALSNAFLAANNLYRKPEYGNADPLAKGFFEQHGRVKTVKFRGHKSEGFWIPLQSLAFVLQTGVDIDLRDGVVFDRIGDVEICRKYVPQGQSVGGGRQAKGRMARLEDSIVDGQFRFHFDTENLRRNMHKIAAGDWISISDKWHGTSVVIAKLLVKRELRWHERLLRRMGVAIADTAYGLTYSSRRVIKAVNGVSKADAHFYTEDIWGVVAKQVADRIPDGFTVYGEIVGFTPGGAPIQPGYTYGCPVGGHRLVVYRVTVTTPAGTVVELTWHQMEEFCEQYGFQQVPELYYGQAGRLFEHTRPSTEEWEEEFLRQLQTVFVHDQDCPYNPKGTPAEGIVLRIDRLHECEAYKLKNFRFLELESKTLDAGVLDTETAQSGEAA